MSTYPVHYAVQRPERFTRMQLLVRLLVFVALGMLGVSLGGIFALVYLALPIYAAIRLASLGSPREYQRRDGPRVIAMLHWFASISAWLGLVADRLPASSPGETVTLAVDDRAAQPTAGTALVRLLTGLPSALVLLLLCWFGIFVWLWAALSILFTERVGPGAFRYLVGLQRWSVRLFAHQAGLVDKYPPFSFSDTWPQLPEAQATA